MQNDYLNDTDNLLKLSQSTPRDLRKLQVKLNYLGPQKKSFPSVVFTTFYHIIQMDWFISRVTAPLSNQKAEANIWQFTVSPEEIYNIVTSLAKLPALNAPVEVNEPYLSLMFYINDSSFKNCSAELVVDNGNADIILTTIYNTVEVSNGIARTVIKLLRELLFGK